ncbi:MAG: hypothetical protein V4633_13495 [Pseudomonadota bacterium]
MFKISKLLQFLLGMSGFLKFGVMDGDGGGYQPLDAFGAADAFSSLLGSDDPNESETIVDTPEAKAERLAAEEMSGDEEVTGEATEEPEVTVEIDGKTVKLTKEQIAENYKNGLRQADYTRKTMEAADARKTAEAETAKARQERETYAQQLNNYAIATQSAMQEQAAILTQELLDTDPLEYLRQERTFKERQANLAQAQQQLQQLGQQHQQEQAAAQRAYITEQQEQLLAKLPEWKDHAKAQADANAIKEHLASCGFEGAERDFTDHRLILLARDAMQYRALIERAGKAVKKVAALPTKVERTGTPEVARPDKRTEAMKRLGQSGSINDAANAFSQFL